MLVFGRGQQLGAGRGSAAIAEYPSAHLIEGGRAAIAARVVEEPQTPPVPPRCNSHALSYHLRFLFIDGAGEVGSTTALPLSSTKSWIIAIIHEM
jgi:hypothetical protein